MAFGEDVRHELVERPPRKACCRDAFLSGLIRGAGTLEVRGGGELAVVVELGDPAAVRAASACSGSAGRSARSSPSASTGSTAARGCS